MKEGMRFCLLGLVVIAVLGCAAPQPSPSTSPGSELAPAAPPTGPKRVVAAIKGDGHTLSERINNVGGASVIGVGSVEELINASLSVVDDQSTLRPQLAEAVPSLENGLWRVFDDGRMETTWTIRAGAQWHDGTPFTTEDLVFTTRVGADRDVGVFRDPAYDSIDTVEATNPRTVVVKWKRPFIEADAMFTRERGVPLPKHLLEKDFLEDKDSFVNLPFWTRGYVGTGAYRLRQWELGSHVVLQANEQFVLGRPKIDEIEVKFITDANTLAANLLAGTVDLTLGRGLSLEQGLELRERWKEGSMDVRATGGIVFYPQFIDPDPAIVGDVRFRRALAHAMDRQQMVDTLMAGQSQVAHSFLSPDWPGYREIEPSIVKYEYDVRRATQMIEGLGYTRGSDGLFRDSSGKTLGFDLRVAGGDDLNEKTTLSIADSWHAAGLDAKPAIIPPQRVNDRVYIANFPAFTLSRMKNDTSRLRNFGTLNTPLADNDYRSRGNTSRYRNAEFDSWLDQFFVTIPRGPRLQALGQIVNRITDQLVQSSVFYVVEPTMISNRLVNVKGPAQGSSEVWNAQTWDVK